MGGAEALVFAGFVTVAAWWDLREQRVPNALNAGFAGAGLLIDLAQGGVRGLGLGLGGLGIGLAFGVILHLAKRSASWGDVKLLAAAGAWWTPIDAFTATLAALSGGWLWHVAVLAGRIVQNVRSKRPWATGLWEPVPLVPGLAGGYGGWLLWSLLR